MRKYHDYLKPECFYHIYNRAIGSDSLFREDGNYNFFLEKWDKYLTKCVENWAYCLMPNHFHFLIRIRNQASFDPDAPEEVANFDLLIGLRTDHGIPGNIFSDESINDLT